MMEIASSSLTVTRQGRRIVLEQLESTYQVRAMVQLGFDPEVARVFIFGQAQRSKIVQLGQRKGLIAL